MNADETSTDCHDGYHVRCERHGGCECACHDAPYVDEDQRGKPWREVWLA